MKPMTIFEALSAAGVNVNRDRGAADDLAEDLREMINEAAEFMGEESWTPDDFHLVIGHVERTYSFKEIVLIHKDLFVFCTVAPNSHDFTFLSPKNPVSLRTERTKDKVNHKYALKVTLAFANGRQSIVLNADTYGGVEHLEKTVKNYLFPLFES